jgi:hypothetical protein
VLFAATYFILLFKIKQKMLDVKLLSHEPLALSQFVRLARLLKYYVFFYHGLAKQKIQKKITDWI